MPATAYALLGPTASGKSGLALRLAEAFPIEIVSVDSAQVYIGMDIGTAKPSAAERARVPHHLIDLVPPTATYSTGQFVVDAVRIVTDVLARGRIPLLVGGTMLYYRSLAVGLDALPSGDAIVRAAIDEEAKGRGWPALHRELAALDPQAAARIGPHDAQRIQRALEVFRLTGRPISSFQCRGRPDLPFELIGSYVLPERGELHARIEQRFDAMLRAGLVDEVRALRARYSMTARTPSMRAVGYRQVFEHLEGNCTADEMRSRAIAATRQLAKRQVTWLRSLPDLRRLDPDKPETLLAAHSFL